MCRRRQKKQASSVKGRPLLLGFRFVEGGFGLAFAFCGSVSVSPETVDSDVFVALVDCLGIMTD